MKYLLSFNILIILDSLSESKKLFEDVLSRREKADATRNALAVMTRYKFLFFLPMNIEHNIKHGDFDLVVSDFARARNLFGKFDTMVNSRFVVLNLFYDIIYFPTKHFKLTGFQTNLIRSCQNN